MCSVGQVTSNWLLVTNCMFTCVCSGRWAAPRGHPSVPAGVQWEPTVNVRVCVGVLRCSGGSSVSKFIREWGVKCVCVCVEMTLMHYVICKVMVFTSFVCAFTHMYSSCTGVCECVFVCNRSLHTRTHFPVSQHCAKWKTLSNITSLALSLSLAGLWWWVLRQRCER